MAHLTGPTQHFRSVDRPHAVQITLPPRFLPIPGVAFVPGRTPVLVSRRQCLHAGAVGCLGLSLPDLLRAEGAGPRPTADACIVVFLNGGPSHLDMWDLKPGAPAEVRGPFQPISTSLPGVQLCEHLPKLARHLHRCSLVRSVHHRINNAHAAAVYTGLTGHDRGDATPTAIGAGPTALPALGSVVGFVRPPVRPVVPFVSMPYVTQEGAGGPPQPGFFGGLLGRNRDPLFVLRDPNAPDFAMPELGLGAEVNLARLDTRRRLLDGLAAGPGPDPRGREMLGFQGKAFDLLASPATQRAFRLDQEAPAVRDAYGRNVYGQSVLLARRLVEAGTRLVCISWAPDANATWDTHGNNFKRLKNELLPPFDLGFSRLLIDLTDRGLLDRTLVVVMGEISRTPKINGGAGRDHWKLCYTGLFAGGGLKGGFVSGAQDKHGVFSRQNLVN